MLEEETGSCINCGKTISSDLTFCSEFCYNQFLNKVNDEADGESDYDEN